jgi:phosphatidylinositol-4,5-bisphosphate 3-kinase
MLTGAGDNLHGFQLWPSTEPFDITCLHNVISDLWLYVKFEETRRPILFPQPQLTFSLEMPPRMNFVVAEKKIMKIVAQDPLSPLTSEEKKLLWENRAFLTHIPQALPKVLKSVNWNNFVHAQDMYTLMYDWCELKPAQVLYLLSAAFLDPIIREFAVDRLKLMTDGQLLQFIPQLTQALKVGGQTLLLFDHLADHEKVEPYLFNPLAVFLVDRSLRNRHRLGHSFFWALKVMGWSAQ